MNTGGTKGDSENGNIQALVRKSEKPGFTAEEDCEIGRSEPLQQREASGPKGAADRMASVITL